MSNSLLPDQQIFLDWRNIILVSLNASKTFFQNSILPKSRLSFLRSKIPPNNYIDTFYILSSHAIFEILPSPIGRSIPNNTKHPGLNNPIVSYKLLSFGYRRTVGSSASITKPFVTPLRQTKS